jgi:signal transduction histidine kinase
MFQIVESRRDYVRELSLHILDIAQNSIEAGAANIEIVISEDESSDVLTILIADDGRGIPAEILESIADPFVTSRKTRRVGLGIPLFREAARMAGGDLKIRSRVGEGTEITGPRSHGPKQPVSITLTSSSRPRRFNSPMRASRTALHPSRTHGVPPHTRTCER